MRNGVNQMKFFSSDSCLEGCGGFWQGRFFHSTFPENFKQNNYNINILQFYSIIVCLKCLKLWGKNFCQKKIQIFCANVVVTIIINTTLVNVFVDLVVFTRIAGTS